jgi:hypothetical protein
VGIRAAKVASGGLPRSRHPRGLNAPRFRATVPDGCSTTVERSFLDGAPEGQRGRKLQSMRGGPDASKRRGSAQMEN